MMRMMVMVMEMERMMKRGRRGEWHRGWMCRVMVGRMAEVEERMEVLEGDGGVYVCMYGYGRLPCSFPFKPVPPDTIYSIPWRCPRSSFFFIYSFNLDFDFKSPITPPSFLFVLLRSPTVHAAV